MNTFTLDIVSAEGTIYSGKAERIFATGILGELEIAPKHAALLTSLLPGFVRIRPSVGKEEVVYVSGGVLDVQPDQVTVLADTVVRAQDFNEAEAVKAKQQAEKLLSDKKSAREYTQVRAELARAAGMLRAIQETKKKLKSIR